MKSDWSGESIEEVAERVHNAWWDQRRKEGWTYGSQRDDQAKTHPNMVPYSQLTDGDKEYDRVTVRATIEALEAMGYRLSRGPCVLPAAPTTDPPLAQLDAAIDQLFLKKFLETDHRADIEKCFYQSFVVIAAITATIALLAALVQLSGSESALPRWIEISCTVAASAAVATALLAKFQQRWLKKRYHAERLRAAQFEFRRAAVLHDNPALAPAERLRLMIEAVDKQGQRHTHEIVRELPGLSEDTSPYVTQVSEPDIVRLRDHYVEKRLNDQINWLDTRVKEFTRSERVLHHVPLLIFILSVTAAVAHFSLELGKKLPGFSHALLITAVGAPIVGMGFRTLRGSYEPGRNRLRYGANADALRKIRERIATSTDPVEISCEIFRAERILERELVAWLRLMLEVEAFA